MLSINNQQRRKINECRFIQPYPDSDLIFWRVGPGSDYNPDPDLSFRNRILIPVSCSRNILIYFLNMALNPDQENPQFTPLIAWIQTDRRPKHHKRNTDPSKRLPHFYYCPFQFFPVQFDSFDFS